MKAQLMLRVDRCESECIRRIEQVAEDLRLVFKNFLDQPETIIQQALRRIVDELQMNRQNLFFKQLLI